MLKKIRIIHLIFYNNSFVKGINPEKAARTTESDMSNEENNKIYMKKNMIL